MDSSALPNPPFFTFTLKARVLSTVQWSFCPSQLHVQLVLGPPKVSTLSTQKDGKFCSSSKAELTSYILVEDSCPSGRFGVIHSCYGNATNFSLLESKMRVVFVVC